MGINVNGLRFLLHAKSVGVDFSKTAMIGRQGFHLSFSQFCHVIGTEFNHDADIKTLEGIYHQKFADDLFRYLGAHEVHSYDYSEYEGATHIHDFNDPIPERYIGQYSALIETGTLEHIFNFPVAVKNCMQMIKVGGHYLGSTPTNNYMGHGFYQFSPVLYFRVFTLENGFCLKHILFHEGRETKKWFQVADPDDVKRTVGRKNSIPTLLLILAQKTRDCPIFSSFPQQAFYFSRPTYKIPATNRKRVRDLLSLLPIKRLIRKLVKSLAETDSEPNPEIFKPFNPFETKSKR